MDNHLNGISCFPLVRPGLFDPVLVNWREGVCFWNSETGRFARGYRSGLAAAGNEFDPDLYIEGDLSEAGGYQAALTRLSRQPRPTAILGINDLTALDVFRTAKDRGVNVGTEPAIAGHDGIQETEFTNPPLTTLYQPTMRLPTSWLKCSSGRWMLLLVHL
jgi:DNA-binding LacI/PurR family transcriptional regulator